jgi:undecaprenyl phosphate N,N'-diacetylbacillosamine 1-phosphate transferase
MFDFTIALIAICVLSVLIVFIFAVLFVSNSGKALFTQDRPGRGGKIFKVIKFKTMNDRKEESGKLLPDDQRITSLGRFIRSTSMDELPQLFNVLKGDMSLIGPRPLLVKYLSLYNSQQARRHEVRPGITGWAQVNGRNAISWEQKFEYDVWYIDHLSLVLDIKILFLTIKKVFFREGISSATSQTTEAFKGNLNIN